MLYTNKLIVHIFTIMDSTSLDGTAFCDMKQWKINCFWRGVLYRFSTLPKKNLYSDWCTGQNRNANFSIALFNLAQTFKISFEQTFSEKSHNFIIMNSMSLDGTAFCDMKAMAD